MFQRKMDFKYIKFPVKIKDIHKIEKKNCIGISVFGYDNKVKCSICVSRNTFKIQIHSLLMGEESKRHYVLIKCFNKFLYDQPLHCGRKNFCCSLQAFSTKEY